MVKRLKNVLVNYFYIKMAFLLYLVNIIYAHAEIVESFDLMPFENNISITEINLTKYKNNLFPNTLGATFKNSLRLNQSSDFEIGFLSSGQNKIGIDIKFLSTEFNSKFSKENLNPIILNISLLRPTSSYFLSDWDRVFTTSFGILPKYEILCYEGNIYTVGGKSSICNISGKTYYSSSANGFEAPAATVSSMFSKVGIGLRRQNVEWDKKIIFGATLESIIKNYNTNLGSGFNSIEFSDFINIPSEEVYHSNFIKLAAFQAKKISEKWGLGAGITSYTLLSSNNKKNLYDNTRNNIRIDTKLTRKVKSNYFFSIGGQISTNYNFGYEPLIMNERTKNLYTSPYGEIKLSFGFSSQKRNETLPNFEIPNELLAINDNVKNKKSTTESKAHKLNSNNTKSIIKDFKNDTLTDYALDYARRYDNSINVMF